MLAYMEMLDCTALICAYTRRTNALKEVIASRLSVSVN